MGDVPGKLWWEKGKEGGEGEEPQGYMIKSVTRVGSEGFSKEEH